MVFHIKKKGGGNLIPGSLLRCILLLTLRLAPDRVSSLDFPKLYLLFVLTNFIFQSQNFSKGLGVFFKKNAARNK